MLLESWCSWRAGFPSYLTRSSGELHHRGRQHRPTWTTEARCLYFHYGRDSTGTDAEGWLLQPADLSAATTCVHQALSLPRVSWVWFQRCWLHSWSTQMDVFSCHRCPALRGRRCWGEKAPALLHAESGESPAALPLGETENPRKHGIVRKSNYLIIKRLNYSANYYQPSVRLGKLFSIDRYSQGKYVVFVFGQN